MLAPSNRGQVDRGEPPRAKRAGDGLPHERHEGVFLATATAAAAATAGVFSFTAAASAASSFTAAVAATSAASSFTAAAVAATSAAAASTGQLLARDCHDLVEEPRALALSSDQVRDGGVCGRAAHQQLRHVEPTRRRGSPCA